MHFLDNYEQVNCFSVANNWKLQKHCNKLLICNFKNSKLNHSFNIENIMVNSKWVIFKTQYIDESREIRNYLANLASLRLGLACICWTLWRSLSKSINFLPRFSIFFWKKFEDKTLVLEFIIKDFMCLTSSHFQTQNEFFWGGKRRKH